VENRKEFLSFEVVVFSSKKVALLEGMASVTKFKVVLSMGSKL